MVGVNCRNATTVFHSMTISLQQCIEVTTHNLHFTGLDVGHQRRDAVIKIDGFSCIGQRGWGSRRVNAYDMQTSIAYVKTGYCNSVSDEHVVEKPGLTLRRQKKADTTNTWSGGSSKENLPSFWKIALEIYFGRGPSVFLNHEDVDFQISGEFWEFKSSEICS